MQCAENYANEPLEIDDKEVCNECPHQFIGRDIRAVNDTIEAASLAKAGILPVAGGYLDQTAAGVDGIQTVWGAQAEIENRIRSRKSL